MTAKNAGLRKQHLPATDREFLTIQEVAAQLDVGPTTIYEMVSNGEMPAVRIRKSYRIPRKVLETMAAQAAAHVRSPS